MQEFINLLNQNLVGTIFGTVSLALALVLYWRSRISGSITCQSRNVSMVGGSDAVFPAEVEVRYRGTPVPRIISSTVWVWNAGKKTVRGMDIVAKDPLRLSFSGEVLNVRIRKVSREVVQIKADISEEVNSKVCWGFEFLDPGDGGVLEVLHTGSDKTPECTGTIIGLPKGPQYLGHAWDTYAPFKFRLTLFVAIAIGLVMSAVGFVGTEPYLLFDQFPDWILVLVGLFYALIPSYLLWRRRRRFPSSLVVETEGEKDRTTVSA